MIKKRRQRVGVMLELRDKIKKKTFKSKRGWFTKSNALKKFLKMQLQHLYL